MKHFNNFIVTETTTWYPLSIFYTRDDFHKLISATKLFYTNNNIEIKELTVYMSDLQGDRLNIIFTSGNEDNIYIYKFTNYFFQDFIKKNRSKNKDNFSYGKDLWMNYKNNSIIWNRFNIPEFHPFRGETSKFCCYTSILILELYDKDYSYIDNVTTLYALLITKVYKLSLPKETIYQTQINKFPDDNLEIISQYWLHEPEVSTYYYHEKWEEEVLCIYDKLGNSIGFNYMSSILHYQLDLNVNYSTQIINIIKKWASFMIKYTLVIP